MNSQTQPPRIRKITRTEKQAAFDAFQAKERAKMDAAKMSEAQRLEYALEGLRKLVKDADAAADNSDSESTLNRAVTLKRRLGKAEKLLEDYATASGHEQSTTVVTEAEKAFQDAVSKRAAKVQALLRDLPKAEAEKLVAKHGLIETERIALLSARSDIGHWGGVRMRTARSLWQALEASAGSSTSVQALIERGRL